MTIVGCAFGGLCLWLAIRNADWREAARIFKSADSTSILTGMALFGTSMVVRALRWRAILAFRTPVGLGASLQALLTGYAVNSVLPARLGELFRAHYFARRTGMSRSGVLASIVIERLLDLVMVVGILALGLTLAGGGDAGSRGVLIAGATLVTTGVVVLSVIAFVLSRNDAEELMIRLIARLPGSTMIARRLGAMLGDFTQLLQVVRTRHFLIAVLATVPIWTLETGALLSICRAVGIDLGAAGTLSLVGGASLSTLFPTAPGYVGSYQFAYLLILGQFGIKATSAVAAATVVQVYLIGGFTLIGLATWAISSLVPARRAATNKMEAGS